jgi:hypothetical protein
MCVSCLSSSFQSLHKHQPCAVSRPHTPKSVKLLDEPGKRVFLFFCSKARKYMRSVLPPLFQKSDAHRYMCCVSASCVWNCKTNQKLVHVSFLSYTKSWMQDVMCPSLLLFLKSAENITYVPRLCIVRLKLRTRWRGPACVLSALTSKTAHFISMIPSLLLVLKST